jgi:hypothetical protein
MSITLKRKLRKVLDNRNHLLKNNSENILTLITISLGVFFLTTQLITNAILAPYGKELATLKREQTYLLEASKATQENIAFSTAISTTTYLSEKNLSIKPDAKKTVIYVKNNDIIAINN